LKLLYIRRKTLVIGVDYERYRIGFHCPRGNIDLDAVFEASPWPTRHQLIVQAGQAQSTLAITATRNGSDDHLRAARRLANRTPL
jgi:hypothetical protein